MLILIFGSTAFVALCIIMQNDTRLSPVMLLFVYAGIVFFGFCGLLMIWWLAKELLLRQPYIRITGESIIMLHWWRATEIRFADVKSFSVINYNRHEFVGIHYKPDIKREKMEHNGPPDRIVRQMNSHLVGVQESISVTGTGVKAQWLCDLLNERLSPYKKDSGTT